MCLLTIFYEDLGLATNRISFDTLFMKFILPSVFDSHTSAGFKGLHSNTLERSTVNNLPRRLFGLYRVLNIGK